MQQPLMLSQQKHTGGLNETPNGTLALFTFPNVSLPLPPSFIHLSLSLSLGLFPPLELLLFPGSIRNSEKKKDEKKDRVRNMWEKREEIQDKRKRREERIRKEKADRAKKH